jgi:hypothetical protein
LVIRRRLARAQDEVDLGLALQHRRSRDDLIGVHDVTHPQADQVAAAQLTVDREFEERQIPHPVVHLQANASGPHLHEPEWGFLTDELALVSGDRRGRGLGLGSWVAHGLFPLGC